jgi:2-polyprenyl-3-methyl-5-hydroxy-6-metoxy-1,4-benzoquinol methylase
LVYLNPRPTRCDIGAYYPQQYEPYRRAAQTLRSPILDWLQRMKLRSRVRAVTKLTAEGRLLDVGCGSGGFLREMSRLDRWQASGIEISPEMTRFAREELGLEVSQGTLEDAGLPAGTFDVVTM